MGYKFTVVRDSREQNGHGYIFSDIPGCETVTAKLECGDYSIQGKEDVVCIERKKTVSELATNIHQDRFYRELERMQTYKWRYILCEFSLYDLINFPKGANLPPEVLKKLKVTGPYILRKVTEIMIKYHINFLYCGNKFDAQAMCYSILKRVNEYKT